MAEALSDDIDATLNISTPAQANYPGPKAGIHYPLNLHYCGGQSFLSFSSDEQKIFFVR
jgi:hypothetical protein